MDFSAYASFCRATGIAQAAVIPEEENGAYESGRVTWNGEQWRIRTGNVTPRKPGAFVAVWRRNTAGITEPFDDAIPLGDAALSATTEACAGLLVFVAEGSRAGVFTFPRAQLRDLGVLRSVDAPGKRGFRVYPTWCSGLNPQALRTQRAQASAFTELSSAAL